MAFLLAVICLAPIARHSVLSWPGPAAWILLPCRADALAIGILIALADREPAWRDAVEARRRTLFVALFALGFIIVLCSAIGQSIGPMAIWVLDLFYAGIVLLVVMGPRRAAGALSWVGTRSYGLYLWHLPVSGTAASVLGHDVIGMAAATAGSIGIAALLHAWIERPMQIWARRRFVYGAASR